MAILRHNGAISIDREAGRLHGTGRELVNSGLAGVGAPGVYAPCKGMNDRYMIIVTSLDHACEAFERFGPSHVVSILDAGEARPPTFDALSPDRHLVIEENCSAKANDHGSYDLDRCERLIAFARDWAQGTRGEKALLIHCNQGVARSMAAAYIILCTVEEGRSEKSLAARLRAAAPHAEPNLLLVSEGDAALGRKDRMIEAILDLSPCSATVAAPIVTLPVAA